MKSVKELNQEELNELRERWYLQYLDEEIEGEFEFSCAEDISMDTIKEYYKDFHFVEEDFWCNTATTVDYENKLPPTEQKVAFEKWVEEKYLICEDEDEDEEERYITVNIPFTYRIGDEGFYTGNIINTIEDAEDEVRAEIEEGLETSEICFDSSEH